MLTRLIKKKKKPKKPKHTHTPLQSACLLRTAPATCICWGRKSRPATGSFPWKKTQLSLEAAHIWNNPLESQNSPQRWLLITHSQTCYVLTASLSQHARMNMSLMNLSLCASVCSAKWSICVWNLIRDGSNPGCVWVKYCSESIKTLQGLIP